MVLLHLIAAIGRMAVVVRDEHAGVLHQHLRLIASDAAHSIGNRDDRRKWQRRCARPACRHRDTAAWPPPATTRRLRNPRKGRAARRST
ncbi:MAG: hypothetical protein HPM95_02870 [Alphaproteobacteria bacterium]|nr:hypothetical protein [Alphaproteobacteria bacterium]